MNSSSGVKWNLDFLFKGPEDEEIFNKITEIQKNVSHFVEQYKGKIKNPKITADELLAAIKMSEKISNEMIKAVRDATMLPLIIGGGIKTPDVAQEKIRNGADVIVTGSLLEENVERLADIVQAIKSASSC